MSIAIEKSLQTESYIRSVGNIHGNLRVLPFFATFCEKSSPNSQPNEGTSRLLQVNDPLMGPYFLTEVALRGIALPTRSFFSYDSMLSNPGPNEQ